MANTVTYGFVDLAQLFSQRVSDTGVQIVNRAIELTAAEHTRQVDALLSSMVEKTTKDQIRFTLPGTGTLQPLDEWGNPLPRHYGDYYTVAFPIQGAGDAWGSNRVSRALLTVEEANKITLEMLRADADWMRRHILASILDDTTWTFDDPDKGDLSIKPLANGDTDTYPKVGGAMETDDHYLATATAILDASNPFTAIKAELSEHPENSGPYVAYVPTALVAAIAALAVFREPADSNLSSDPTEDNLVGGLGDIGPGQELVGYLKGSNMWIVEWKQLPDEHMIIQARGSSPAPVVMREYAAPELQGFFPEFENVDGGNREVQKMIRYAGFGVQNRVAMVVQQIGNATYEIPTGYATPLAV